MQLPGWPAEVPGEAAPGTRKPEDPPGRREDYPADCQAVLADLLALAGQDRAVAEEAAWRLLSPPGPRERVRPLPSCRTAAHPFRLGRSHSS